MYFQFSESLVLFFQGFLLVGERGGVRAGPKRWHKKQTILFCLVKSLEDRNKVQFHVRVRQLILKKIPMYQFNWK